MIRKLLLFALILFFVVPGALAQTAPQDDEFALVESARRMRASGNAQFNFQDVDMVKFIRFMAELLNENLVLAPGVKGSISVISPKPFPLKEARQVFISVLEMNGYTLQQGAGFGKVVPLQAGSSAESDVRTGKMGPGEGEQT
ncbi:MAG TPA: type II secretion system protein GspD, partial [Aminivibrio sp.]|nr:type II secretion system protein GspD [Aminivibrio sp.]